MVGDLLGLLEQVRRILSHFTREIARSLQFLFAAAQDRKSVV